MVTGSMSPMTEISHTRLGWTRIKVSGIRRTTYEEFMEEQTGREKNNSRTSRRSTLSTHRGSQRQGGTGAEDVKQGGAVKRPIGRGEWAWRLRTNSSTTPGRCTLYTPGVDQTRWTFRGGTTGTGGTEGRPTERRIHQELDVHLDPVLLDQVQDK